MNELIQIEVPYNYRPKVYTYQRGSKWHWKFKLPGDVWFYCFAANKQSVAERNAALKAADLAKGLFTPKEIEKMERSSNKVNTIDEAIARYLASIEVEHSRSYFKTMSWQLKSEFTFFKETLKIDLVYKVKEEHVYKYREHLLMLVKCKKISQVTAKGKLKAVKQLFKWLRKRKMIMTNPCLEVDPIRVDVDKRARTVATPPDVVEKLMAADYKHRFLFPIKEFAFFLFSTGARMGEALHLEVDDIDLEQKIWRVQNKEDCPTKDQLGWSPKTSKERVVPLSDNLIKLLIPLIERAKVHRVVGYTLIKNKKGIMKKEVIEASFIFTMVDRGLSSRRNTVFRRVDNIRGAWGGLFVAAGLVEARSYDVPSDESGGTKHGKYKGGVKTRHDVKVPYTRHDMRRGFNAEAEKAGLELKERCAILGHNQVVNQVHYGGEKQIDRNKLAEKVNQLSESVVSLESYKNRKLG